MSTNRLPRINGLLAAIPKCERDGLYRYGTQIELVAGSILLEAGSELQRVYFPHTGLISLLIVMPDGAVAEAGFIGPDCTIQTIVSTDSTVS